MIFHLTNRACIEIVGQDSLPFLNSILTNDIRKIISNNMLYALLLTPQGKLLYDFFVVKTHQGFLLDVALKFKEDIIKKFKLYKLRAKLEMIERSQMKVYASFSKLNEFFYDPRDEKIGFRCMSDISYITNSLEEYESRRVTLKIVDMIHDIEPNQFFPFELGMQYAIDYQKGCYIGQEIIARTHYKGVVRKGIYHIHVVQGDFPPYTDIFLDGIKIGQTLGFIGNECLAILRHEEVQDRSELKLNDCTLKIV